MRRSLLFYCTLAGLLGSLGVVVAQNPGPSAPPPDPNTVKLIGDRFKPLTYREMTPEQKKMFESLISGERRGAGGPFNVLLRSPEMGDLAQKFGASMRFHSSMPPKLNEMAIIITARHWTSHYEWYAHRRAAANAGLSPAIIEAIAAGKRPSDPRPPAFATFEDGYHAACVVDAILESHRRGAVWTKVNTV